LAFGGQTPGKEWIQGTDPWERIPVKSEKANKGFFHKSS